MLKALFLFCVCKLLGNKLFSDKLLSFRKKLLGVLLLIPLPLMSVAESFPIDDIKFNGLQRVSLERAYSLLPFSAGEFVDTDNVLVSLAITKLFESGDFDDVEVLREGNVLIFKVSERPAISEINIDGNNAIPTEQLMDGLKRIGLEQGAIFKRSALESIQKELERSYMAQGRYGAGVIAGVEPLSRNRVKINIDIREGAPVKIERISFIGNTRFTDDALLAQMQLRASHFWTFFNSKDKYARDRLIQDVESIKTHYLSYGYLDYVTDNVQVSVTPDQAKVYITINISEGEPYNVGDVKLVGNLTPEIEDKLNSLIRLETGDVFNQSKVTQTKEAFGAYLSTLGFYNADIQAIPKLNKAESDNASLNTAPNADIMFAVKTGDPVYVRQIRFIGNGGTSDDVLRREMRQLEGSVANKSAIQLSKSRLERLGYIGDVKVDTIKVPGRDDQVDLDVSVTEKPSGQFSANMGFSDGSGVVFGLNVSQSNFFGTGNSFTLGANRSSSRLSLNLSFNDPYVTAAGVSRGWGLFYSTTDFDQETNNSQSWQINRLGGYLSLGYPTSEYSRLSYRLGIDRSDIFAGNFAAIDVVDYLDNRGSRFWTYSSNLTWSRNTFNRGFLPTKGSQFRLSGELALPGSTETYYRLNGSATKYFELAPRWAIKLRSNIGYGNGYDNSKELPFYKSYFSGGLGSVRGYETNSLGPKSPSRGFEQTTLLTATTTVVDITGNTVTFTLLRQDGSTDTITEQIPAGALLTVGQTDTVTDTTVPAIVDTDENGTVYNDATPNSLGGNFQIEGGVEFIFPAPYISSDTLRTSLFLETGNVFRVDSPDLIAATNIGVNGNHNPDLDLDEMRYSAGIGLQWFTVLGPLTFSYAWALNEKEIDETERFQFSLGQTF